MFLLSKNTSSVHISSYNRGPLARRSLAEVAGAACPTRISLQGRDAQGSPVAHVCLVRRGTQKQRRGDSLEPLSCIPIILSCPG